MGVGGIGEESVGVGWIGEENVGVGGIGEESLWERAQLVRKDCGDWLDW